MPSPEAMEETRSPTLGPSTAAYPPRATSTDIPIARSVPTINRFSVPVSELADTVAVSPPSPRTLRDIGDISSVQPDLIEIKARPPAGTAADPTLPLQGRPVGCTPMMQTIRLMEHRAFMRRYLGSHKRTWGSGAASIMFVFASFLELVVYLATCGSQVITATPATEQSAIHDVQEGFIATAINSGMIVSIALLCILICRCRTSWRITATMAIWFLIFDFGLLISLALVRVRGRQTRGIRAAYLRAQTLLLRLLSTPLRGRNLQGADSIEFFRWSSLLGQSCATSQGTYFIWHWYVLAHPGLQLLVLLGDIFWSTVVGPLGTWYILHSKPFAKAWWMTELKPMDILTPVYVTHHLQEHGLEAYKSALRFGVKRGIKAEIRAAMWTTRAWRRIKTVACLGRLRDREPYEPPLQENRPEHPRWPWRIHYYGEVDSEGRPHGFGYWRGDLIHGENFVGFWDRGNPVGPAKSREVSSGSGLMTIKLGWCKCVLSEKRLAFGIASVECSVSGRFFRGFPRVDQVEAPSLTKPDTKQFKKIFEWLPKIKVPQYQEIPELQTEHLPSLEDGETSQDPLARLIALGDTEEFKATEEGGVTDEILSKHQQKKLERNRKIVKLRHAKARAVRKSYAQCLEWMLQNVHPHTPAFGLRTRTELTVSVDPERGLDILGLVPIREVVTGRHRFESFRSQRSESVESTESLAVSPPAVRRSSADAGRVSTQADAGTGPTPTWSVGSDGDGPHTGNTPDVALSPPLMAKLSVPETGGGRLSTQATASAGGRDTIYSALSGPPPQGTSTDGGQQCITINITNQRVAQIDDKQLATLDAECPELAVQGWVPMEAIGISEVLIYVHGFNNSQMECQQTLGQMAAFGNFPGHLKIIVFVWPGGNGFTQFFVARKNAEDSVCLEGLKQLLVALKDRGIRQVHFLVHSMGSRLYLKALRNILQDGSIIACYGPDVTGKDNENKIQIVTSTFMNPEYFLDEFVDFDYDMLRSCCNHITIYADGNDQALYWSEVFSRHEALGRSVFGLHRQISTPEATPKAPSRQLHLQRTISLFQWDQSAEDPIALDVLANREVMRKRIHARCVPWSRNLRSRIKRMRESTEWLDVDIIDTTFMDRNVHMMRHSFWNLNREVIEDLRELLVSRKRARQRTGRLDRREGNVWVFRVAPSFLTSIFESTW